MPRVKGGTVARNRRKKILKLAKGYVGSRSLLYRTANEQVMKSLSYAYRDRKQRKREFRKLWIQRINAAAKQLNFKYSLLIHGLALANVQVNRKMLADIAVSHPEDFKAYVTIAQEAIKGNLPKPVKVKVKEVEEKAPKAEVIEPVEKVATKATTTKTTTTKKPAAAKTTTTKTTAAKKPATAKATTTKTTAAKKPAAAKATTTKTTATKKPAAAKAATTKTTATKKPAAKKEA
jgi:large subunit ribosomal protein L20